ncbi:nucleoside-diphosphate sugar epimerase : Nucleoside-diphosphate sugar epimerase OS=Skermanella stibiiresistens SB22 GN=N825_01140 PE=4 SV=1: Epimerase [Gemmata massiliana]|uniref:NAD-dependent epimerase/dehydratase domain-containing protein n=1 Tax=Gemmata massiliana TaxID=1210884 RepID=A0A6P2CY63_9BACT|nr:NAD-dependent epimerase/dehydratase family protein [Gemmata massiliana]VTR92734.1 nucleoside-diphosphate sugar epimerase : Nucleoside-diphosphate sugar epimerase OS=Skermanella stibiiresistens SB22 GN=N825_01140 PE=4 SV=1: Epimerase [Gemmata massiliana]
MRYFVTGGAGFIGSNLVDRLLAAGHHVTAFDNFSTGQRPFLADAQKSARFALVEGDLLDKAALTRAVAGHDLVFHLAANADVRFGTDHPDRDLQQNTIATFNVLEAMRLNGVKRIGFSSTGSVYGEAEVFPTPENAPFPVQTSLYAASKVAGEGLISAYATGFGFQAFIFRFVSILGERYTHGHVFDFYAKLLANPHAIEVLGNGKQRKSYLYVQDCVDAILTVAEKAADPVTVVNLGADEYCQVDDSLGWICERLGLTPKVNHTGGTRGWIGDSPFIFLDTAKLKSFGWRQTLSIREAVVRTLDYLRANPWVLESRRAA